MLKLMNPVEVKAFTEYKGFSIVTIAYFRQIEAEGAKRNYFAHWRSFLFICLVNFLGGIQL